MKLTSDKINEGLEFELEMNGELYSGIVTIEAIRDKFEINTTDIEKINSLFQDDPIKLEQEICNAIQRHPPIGKEHILIFPHHMR